MSDTFYRRFGKRGLDLAASVLGLVILAPVFLIVAVLVKATSFGPVFFRQIRVGQFEKPFRIFKFRSMAANGSGRGSQLTAAGDPRITPVGRWLRRSKIDELPQLINVLLGHMSLVGPRPEVPEYAATYSAKNKRIFQKKPGMTSPVAARNLEEEELLASQDDKHDFYLKVLLPAKLEIELAYCSNITFVGDLKWILATLVNIAARTESLKRPLLRIPEKQA